jgi:C-terminal processing protease CtpA/Prc
MTRKITQRITIGFILLLVLAHTAGAAEQKLGFVTQVEGEGFFLNPIVTKVLVTEVTKGSLAEAAGVKSGDLIIQIEGQDIAGKRALALQPYLKLNPGQTRTMRVRHQDGTEAEVRITKPKEK